MGGLLSDSKSQELLLLSDCCLQLGACGQLHAVTGGNLDSFAGLRVTAGTSCTVGALDCHPTGDGDLLALGDGRLETWNTASRTAFTVAWLLPDFSATSATSSVRFLAIRVPLPET